MVTPLLSRDALDVAGLERLVERIIGGGAHGLFLLGTTGEGSSLSHLLQDELIRRATAQVAERVPVIVNVTDPASVESVRIACIAADAGAEALAIAPPYYFPVEQSELACYVEKMAAELPLPVLLYNIPALTKTAFEVETIRRLMSNERIVGLKDSSGDIDYFRAVQRVTSDREDWSLFVGQEDFLADAIEAGGHGGICGGGNLFPELFVEWYGAVVNRDITKRHILGALVSQLQGVYGDTVTAPSVIRGLKCALSQRAICKDTLADPLAPLSAEERDRIEQLTSQLEVSITNALECKEK